MLSPSFLGSLTALTWVCSLVDPPGSSRHSGDELPDPFVIACIGRLPANLKFLKPEDRQSVTGVDEETKGSSAHSGNGSAPNRQEAAIDWGPMISHCFASYWECIRYALQHQGSFGPEAATTATADSTSNVVAAASQADRRDVSVGCSDVVALAQVCLESLDLAGLNLATVIECLSLLVPRVRKYERYWHESMHACWLCSKASLLPRPAPFSVTLTRKLSLTAERKSLVKCRERSRLLKWIISNLIT